MTTLITCLGFLKKNYLALYWWDTFDFVLQLRQQELEEEHAAKTKQKEEEEKKWRQQQLTDFLMDEQTEDYGDDPDVSFNIEG